MKALSLVRIGQLKARAERDAKTVLQDLLGRCKDGREISEAVIRNFEIQSLTAYPGEEAIGLPGDVIAVADFYSAEFRRQLDALWDLLNAAAGTAGVRR